MAVKEGIISKLANRGANLGNLGVHGIVHAVKESFDLENTSSGDTFNSRVLRIPPGARLCEILLLTNTASAIKISAHLNKHWDDEAVATAAGSHRRVTKVEDVDRDGLLSAGQFVVDSGSGASAGIAEYWNAPMPLDRNPWQYLALRRAAGTTPAASLLFVEARYVQI